jgi:hypothetical protein
MAQSAKVIEVIDHYQVRIDKGSMDGIYPEERFEIYKTVLREDQKQKEEIQKGIGKVVEVFKDSSIIKSVREKTGGKKEMTKTGSGEAFTGSPQTQDDTTFVYPQSTPLPFSEAKPGDLARSLKNK